jgi:heme-degrading monooxygenase HmoA
MILVANRIYIAPAHRKAFEHLFATRAGLVDHMPGFIANQILKPTSASDPYVIQTLWASRADFVAWTKSEEFAAGHARTPTLPPEAFTQPTRLEIHEVFQQTKWRDALTDNGANGQD